MTQEQKEQVATHFDELYSIAIGLTPNIPDDISEAMKTAYMAGADYAIDMFAMNWISVEDELPHGGVYFFCRANGDVFIASDELGLDFYDDITHWMPLPAPPKEGGEQ